jgi:phospholipid transport system substrate-binding protein
MRKTIFILVIMLMGLPSLARGEQPINILKKSVNETIRLLKDPQYQGDDQQTAQQQKLDEIARRIFDFAEFSMRVLGSNWNRFSMQERNRFADVFSRFLSKYYIGELQKKYTDEKVIFLNQELLSDSKALVKVKVLWKDMEIPVDVRMLKRSGRWKAYDVSTYGVSAMQNYRAQLWALSLNNSPDQIIELIKSRMEEEGKEEGI